MDQRVEVSRRRFLQLGAVGATTFLVVGCSSDGGSALESTTTSSVVATTADATASTAASAEGAGLALLRAADFADLAVCRVTPAQPAGPFYLDDDLLRRDITEDRTGTPLRIGLQIVDADCVPIEGSAVDIWHSDVAGEYSGFVGRTKSGGTTFLRGTQVTDVDGVVEFASIYPGWYPGRTVHIHIIAWIDGQSVLTTQVYLPDDVTSEVHATEPYAARGASEQDNDSDSLTGDVTSDGTLATVSAEADGYLARHVIGLSA